LNSTSTKQKDLKSFCQTSNDFSIKNLIKKINDTQNSKEQKKFQDKQKILYQMKLRNLMK
jgi:uncharacterized protein YpiB (UPF0302 family)